MEAWIRLANLQLPTRTARALLERFGTPEAVFDAPDSDLREIPGLLSAQVQRLRDPTYAASAAQLRFLRDSDTAVVPREHPRYPPRLREIEDAPPVLFMRGEMEERDRFAVAIVGSRQASPYGRSVTAKLCRDLARAGLTIVSGGAIGIDTTAHQATVEAGGRTVAVLGCGLDVPYPRHNQPLFQRIVAERLGAVVSEFAPGAQPEAWRFPQRNRIISGLAAGIVIVEAGAQSGALLTASLGAEQGREIMAVPGNVDRPGSRGTNALIRDGAALVEDADDVLRAMGILSLTAPREDSTRRPAPLNLPPDQRATLETLSLTPRHLDAIAADLNLTSSQAGAILTMLELGGFARRLPGNTYIRSL